MPPPQNPNTALVELSEKLQALARVLHQVPLDDPAYARTIDYLIKEIRAIAAQLERNAPQGSLYKHDRKAASLLYDLKNSTNRFNLHDPGKKSRYRRAG
jgi:hypothetical protein